MDKTIFFEDIQILCKSGQPVYKDAVLIFQGLLDSFGQEARSRAKELEINSQKKSNILLAPPLVDPHSILPEPLNGRCENLNSLKKAGASAGYGQIALLPRSKEFRDSPEKLHDFTNKSDNINIHLWGNFSVEGKGERLSKQGDLLSNGSIGLADDDWLINLSLLQKGLVIGEMNNRPILLAPRDKSIQGNGIAREGVEALRAGWNMDPRASETIPLQQIIELQRQHQKRSIRVMNISTKEGVSILKKNPISIISSVNWWHLITDQTMLSPCDMGWRVTPSLGNRGDRNALINGIKDNIISAISVHSVPLDDEEILLPPDKRLPGLSGHQLVLPLLWQELIVKEKLSIEKLWNLISFGPSKMIKSKEERLETGSRRWILFDPDTSWTQTRHQKHFPNSANQPLEGKKILGKVIMSGLKT